MPLNSKQTIESLCLEITTIVWDLAPFQDPICLIYVKAGAKLIFWVAVWIVENFNCYPEELGLS